MYHIAICDDEEYFRLREKKLIEKYMEERGGACSIDLYASGAEMLSASDAGQQYDMIFLDVNMEEMDGMETAERIRALSDDVYIVFVTAYISYAPQGYKVGAVRYLLKEDAGLERALNECLDTILEKMGYRNMMYELDFQNGRKKIPTDSILYVESRLHKVIFFVREDGIKEYSRYDRLDVVERKLRQYGFCRVHQSFLVNMKYAKNVVRYTLSLAGGAEINISKRYYKNVEAEYIRRQGDID